MKPRVLLVEPDVEWSRIFRAHVDRRLEVIVAASAADGQAKFLNAQKLAAVILADVEGARKLCLYIAQTSSVKIVTTFYVPELTRIGYCNPTYDLVLRKEELPRRTLEALQR